MKTTLKITLMAWVMVCMTLAGYSQLMVSPETDADLLANTLIDEESGVTFISTTLIGADGSSGTFTNGEFGFESGILLTSGDVANAIGPNIWAGVTTIHDTPGDPDLDIITSPFTTQDAAVLEMVFIPDGDLLEFTYVFGSDEYNEYVCSEFNDAFGFFISGGVYANENIAILPGSDPPVPVAINNVNNGMVGGSGSISNCTQDQLANSAFFVDNANGTHLEYDGYTVPLAVSIPVVPGTEYTIRLAIADAGDAQLDSGVFIEGESFVSVVCDAGDISLNGDFIDQLDICIDGLPEFYTAGNNGAGINDIYTYVLTSPDNTILHISENGTLPTATWMVGTYFLYGISYAGEISGLEFGQNLDDVSSTGCLSMSEQIEINILDPCAQIYDCPNLNANYGDNCDDGDAQTQNDIVTTSCECIGEPIPMDCPDLNANYGDDCDDGDPLTQNDTVSTTCECIGEPIPLDCPEIGANIGDVCVLDGLNGVIIEGCECLPNQVEEGCQEYVYFLADNTEDEANIYRVDVSGDMAVMTWLKTLDYSVHIAYNPIDDFLYIVRATNGSFRMLDVSVVDGAISDETLLSEPMPSAVAVAINADGKLLIGGSESNHITSVNTETGIRSPYADADIDGGDIAFGIDGTPFLATRSGGILYMVVPGFPNIYLGDLSPTVTGLAVAEDGSLLYSETGVTTLTGRASDGSANGVSLDLILDGSPFTTSNGDLAYGCMDPDLVVEDCESFSTYYVNHGPGVSGSDLYGVEFMGTEAVMTFLINLTYEVHMGMNAVDGIIYLVKANGSFVEFYDISNGMVISNLPIDGDINQLYAVVYNPNDGLLYVGDAGDDEIYTIDLTTGTATFYAEAPVQGGDLVLQDGTLYLAQRNNNRLHTVAADADGIPDGINDATHIGSLPDETNGMAAANNTTSLICAQFGTSTFAEISNTDGSLIGSYDATLSGDLFTIKHGDLASGCADGQDVNECNYKLYYTHQPVGGNYDLLEVELHDDGTATYTTLMEGFSSAHIALSPDGTLIYIVGGSSLQTFDIASGLIIDEVNIELADGTNLSGFPAAVCHTDGTIYIAGGGNKVYTLATDGVATVVVSDAGVSGGDLVFAGDDLWLVNRTSNTFINITSPGDDFAVTVDEINGAALLDNDNIIVADGNGGSLFKVLDKDSHDVIDTYDIGLPLYNGDLAGGCSNPPNVEEPEPGECYATEATSHILGTTMGGGAISADRTDPTQALGQPERTDEMVFLSLGYGGSATFTFDGIVPNEVGDDIEVVETTFGDATCDSYPEYADIYVSMDGADYSFAGTVCKDDGFVDISDAGDFPYISHIRVVNNDAQSTSSDGYDLDGIVALHNCEDEGDDIPELISSNKEAKDVLLSYPNPANETSIVNFQLNKSGRVLLEVFDISGRAVQTVRSQYGEAGINYRTQLDVSNMPNGIYIYKLTTATGITVHKFMVSH